MLAVDERSLLDRAGPLTISAKAVVRAHDRILLLQQPDGLWDLPGGKLEPGEGITAGLVREVFEETGLAVQGGRLLGDWIRQRPGRPDLFVTLFLCDIDGKPKRSRITLSAEHQDARFFDIEAALALDMIEGYRRAVRQTYLALTAA